MAGCKAREDALGSTGNGALSTVAAMSRTADTRLRITYSLLVALAAACLFCVFGAQNANATVWPTLTTTYSVNSPGAHPNVTQAMTLNYADGNGNGNSGDDISRLSFDWPAGLIGDPNAIAEASRCNVHDYTGGSPASNTTGYGACPASSLIGSISVGVTASAWVGECNLTLTGSLYLLRNRPTATPEVPTYVGVHVSGTPSGGFLNACAAAGNQSMDMTAKIILRPWDNGLRLEILDTLPRNHYTGALGGTADIRVESISQTINGMAPSGKPFLTTPTRCDAWVTTAYTRGHDSNASANSDVHPVDGTNDSRSGNGTFTPTCTSIPALNLGFNMSTTTSEAGAPVGIRAEVTNTVPTTNVGQGAYAKQFQMVLPVGYKINPGVATRLGSAGCTEAEFLRPQPGMTTSKEAPTCPAGSQVGTVAVDAPEFTDDLTGRLYLGQPQAGDEAAGRYRLYVYAARGETATKFQGTAIANPTTGQVTVTFDNAGAGLPQFNYRSFILDFNTASTGVGTPSSGAVSSPNAAQQLLMNPQVCTTQADFQVSITPWTTTNQAVYNVPVNTTPNGTRQTISESGDETCAFTGFAPTFNANLTSMADGTATTPEVGVGKHPRLDLTVTRGDRQDNLRDMVFDLPTGFGGSVSAIPTADRCQGTKAQIVTNGCPAASAVGTVDVITGTGSSPATLAGTVYMAEPEPGDTARLAIITPAVVGPFNLGRVVNITKMTLPSASTFRLRAATMGLEQSILGVPILYKQINLRLNGIIGGRPFLQNPSVCGQVLNFNASITSNGDLSGNTPGSGNISTVNASDTHQTTTCAGQSFGPTLAVTPTTTVAAQPTGLNIVVNQTQTSTGATPTTVQQSTINAVTVQMPVGLEINPGFAQASNACPTSMVNSDITNSTTNCAGVATKIADVTVTTPLLPTTVPGQVYLEESGNTPATRYKFVMYLQMPGGLVIVRGGATVNGSTTGGVTGSTGAVGSGTGRIIATFTGLPDVPYSSMSLNFNQSPRMFVNPETVGGPYQFDASFTATNTSATPNSANSSASYSTTTNGGGGWAPTFSQTVSSTTPNAHPDVTLTVNRPEVNQQLASVQFDLPSGLTGAPAAVPTCTQAQANAANCAANTRVGTVVTEVGSALIATPTAGLATLNGTLHNTVAPAGAPAKLTAIVPVVLGPFNLGSMTLPVDVSLRGPADADPYGLTAQVSLPDRYEGVKVRYRRLTVTILGQTPVGSINFLTNPSSCGVKTTTARMTSAQSNVATGTQTYTVASCASGGFGTNPSATVATNPAAPANQAAVGLNTNIANASTNPTIKRVRLTFPAGMTVNPAVGNYGANFTCPTATINSSAGSTDACQVAGKQVVGTAQLTTPLISGTFTGNIYLESPDAGGSPDARFRIAMIVGLPGQMIVLRGKVRVQGDTTVPVGATGSVDSGTGVVTADFDNLPDLAVSTMNISLSTGNRALLVTPTTCSATNTITAELWPYNNPGATPYSQNSNFSTQTNCQTVAFAPTFSASVSNPASGANSNLTMSVTNPGTAVNYLRTATFRMPTGFVANTNNVARCTQAAAAAATCATPVVGTVATTVGTNAETIALSGSIYNVTPSAGEAARLQAVIPVLVGPFNLGNLSVPVVATLRSDLGINATAQLPQRYEGIDIRTRSLSVTLSGSVGGQPFFQNPSVCRTVNDFQADIGNGSTSTTLTSASFAINGCPRDFGTTPTFAVTASTLQAADPVGLTFNIGSAANNPTIKRVQIQFPDGMEINPAFGNLLAASGAVCTSASVAGCSGATSIATVSLTTPLLSTNPITGNVYVVSPGGTAATRYRVVMIVDLPGSNELVVPGAVTVNGSTDIPTASTGAVGSVNSGTGRISADFDNIPDLGFTALTLTFNSGAQAMVVNPDNENAAQFSATFTPNSGGVTTSPVTSQYTTTNAGTAFNPSFSASASTYVSNGHPTLTMDIARNDKQKQLRDLTIHFPAGLTANTAALTKCSQASAAAASCLSTAPTSQVGTLPSVTIGSGAQTYNLSDGRIFAVTPNADEPARFQAILPVQVGPYNLGNLTVPISASLRADYGIDLTTALPTRYEGIAVRIRSMQMVINGTVNGQPFMNNPSRCTAGTISADMRAADSTNDSSAANNSSAYTTTSCPPAFGTNPSVAITGVNTTTQAPTGMNVAVSSATGNPTIGQIQLTFPQGMSLNPAVGNNGSNTTCPTATIDAITPSTDGCPAASQQGTVTLTSPLISGTFNGKLYLEQPGTTAATRYRLAIVVQLPGRTMVVRGGATVNGSTDIPANGTGAKDSGTGVVTATFPAIPDLAFGTLNLTLAQNNRSMLITPSVCNTGWQIGTSITANGGGSAVTGQQTFDTTTSCTQAFSPTFNATLSTYDAGAHPDLHITATNGGSTVNTIRNFNVKLPVGLVANTNVVARCPQADATAGLCGTTTPNSAVGSITTTMGASAEQLSLSGTVYNVVPSATEPAHLTAMIPVLVGPFNLGNLPVDIATALNNGTPTAARTYGVDTFSQLPTKYEGIDVRVRSIDLTVNGMVGGQPFMINPSECIDSEIGADFVSPEPVTVSRSVDADFVNCDRDYTSAPTLSVTPSTTQAGQPVGLTFAMGTNLLNPTTEDIKVTFPEGVELNPAAANGLTYCSAAQLATDPGQLVCDSNGSRLGTVTLTTPLLTNPQSGAVYLEQPGSSATDRYKAAIVVKLPGKDLVLHGQILLNGSTTIPSGATGSIDSGTGRITAEFPGIPDLGFTNMQVAFNGGANALFVNPDTCDSFEYSAEWTPHGAGDASTATDDYTTDTNCDDPLPFSTSFNGSVSPLTAAGNPTVQLNFTRPDNNDALRNLTINLPTGLVAATTATTTCSQTSATAGNCLASQVVGTVATSIGSGPSTYALSGSLYNVAPNASEPARFQAIIPVLVGPFDLGKLSIPVATSLRADLGVTATAQLPLRYEGIAVRVRSLGMQLNPTANGNPFMINPSVCDSHQITTTATSLGGETSNGSYSFATNGCAGFPSAPTLNVTPSTTNAAAPVGLTFTVGSSPTNPTINRVQLTFPEGIEVNPAFANGLNVCSTADINAGSCNPAHAIADVTLTTHLLGQNRTGKVYVETPGTTANNRYRVAMVIDLPGPNDLTVRGEITINGSTTIPSGGAGSVDSGSGQITADFKNIPDLGFTQLTMAFNSGARAFAVNPDTCTSAQFNGQIFPNGGGASTAVSSSYTPTGCGTAFDPSFTTTFSPASPNAASHPNMTFNVSRPDLHKSLRGLNIHLPAGLVANTSVVADNCSQASAQAGTCETTEPSSQVGTFNTSFGSGAETYALTGGKLFQVEPDNDEPAHFAAIIPVLVGPFDLGTMSIPVDTTLRADYGLDATTTLPTRYEGIAVRLRSLSMTLNGTVNGQPYVTMPSKCEAKTISASMTAADGSNDSNNGNNSSAFTPGNCAALTSAYNPSVSASVSPTTAGHPTGFSFTANVPANSSTTGRVQVQLPQGMEISPGVGNGLVACSTAQIDAGGAACKLTSANLGTVTIETPLLPAPQTGEVFLETPGVTANDRYKLAIVLHLPGRDMVIHGGALVDGSTNIAGGLGSTDSAGTATGRVTADFPGIPDLGFTSMTVAFNDTGNKLLVNPKTAGTHTVNATLTPNSGVSSASRTTTFATSGGTSTVTGFNPGFTGSITPTTSAGNPNLTMTITNPTGMQEVKSFAINLPQGLVARTTSVPRCSQNDATAGNCVAGNRVGSAITTIGSGTETYSVTGDIYNVTPDSNQPARLQAVVPVVVGPFNLGKLSVAVPTTLNSDLTVTASATLPSRFEGIAVRVRSLQMTVEGNPNGNKFMVAPTRCGTSSLAAAITSDTGNVANVTAPITVTGCPTNFGASPAFAVSRSTSVRNTPVNLGFTLTSNADNPTIGRVLVEMPNGFEINPAFGDGLEACPTAAINAGGDTCPAAAQLGTVSLKTQLLDPSTSYTGKVWLEEVGTTAATRYKLALVVDLPGADLVVRGKVTVVGSTDITGGTGSVSDPNGYGKILADFDTIPDLGFTELNVAFNSATPMLVNPDTCQLQTFTASVTPSSNGSTVSPTAGYTTTPAGCFDSFAPTFSAVPSDTTAGGHPDLTLNVARPNDSHRPFKEFNLNLPVGLVASTVATTQCPQATAMAGNCPGSTRVGDFTTTIGQFSGAGTGLELAGQIFNVVPNGDEPARLLAQVDVVVGPFNLGKLVIPISTELRSDLGINADTNIPTRYEGIAVRIKNMQILLYGYAQNGNPFLQYPSKCTPATRTISAQMISDKGDVSNRNSTISVTGCPQNFVETPTVDVSTTPSETTVPTSLGVTIGSSPENSTISRIQVALPEGMSVNAAVGNGLVTCSTAQLNSDHTGCPVSSRQGTVQLSTPLLAGTYNGYVYLEDPQGTSHTTRYRLAVVVDLPGAQMVVRGKVLIDGSSTIPTGGTGAIDTGTGRITTDFDNIPDLSFSQLKINFNTGPRALLTNPDECSTHTVQSTITPSAGGSNAVVNSDFDVSFDGNGEPCPAEMPFSPSFSASAASTTSGGNTDLAMAVVAPAKNQALRELDIHLPAGLVADTDAVPQCSQANAAAGNCAAGTQVGTLTTKLGTGSETLDINGAIHNVVPNSDEPARLQAIIPVVVGPYNLGKLSLAVPTQLRSGDYGVDATTQIPTRYEGIAVRMAELQMNLLGNVGGNGFIKNPSKCGVATISADMLGSGGDSVSGSSNYTVDGCPRDFVSSPTITVSGTSSETAVPTGMTLDIHSADDNPTILSVETTMPDGLSLNPAVGNSLDACATAAIDAGGASCPAESQIGTVQMVTPLLAGTHTGKVFLETPGNTATDRYKLAIIIDLPGTKVIVRGTTAVDGSSDLTNGTGATDSGTGRVVATFPSLPDLNFSDLKIAFAGGPDALFTNAETCGTQTVSAVFTPQSSSNTASDSDNYNISYDGAGASCPGSEPFNPTFSGSVSTTQAAGNPNLTLNVSRNDKTQQLREFNLHLPAGLVADTVQTPRCPQVDAESGNCAANTVVGSVATAIGTGSETLTMNGNLHNVVPDSDEPARLAAVIDVQVGPYDLGKLAIPVETEIVTGALPSDLTIDTYTSIPSRYEGVPVRIRNMQIVIDGMAKQGTPSTADDKPFMINPSRCGLKTVTADMEAPGGASATGSFNFTTTGCPAAFNPSIATSVSTSETGVPTGYNLAINVPGNSSSIRKVSTLLPEGMEINPGVANTGGANGLQACDVADVETETGPGGATACPANSIVGAVTLDTPLLPGTRAGKVYLVTPGNSPSTRYKLALAIDLPGPDLVVHGQAQVNGSGAGADSGTGQVSATFDDLPDLQFSKLEVQFASGDHAMLTNPRSCGTHTTNATLTPWSVTSELNPDADAVDRSASFTTDYNGAGASCPGSESFDPSFSVEVDGGDTADQASSTDLTLSIDAGAKDARLTEMTIGLPVGLVANTTAATQCSQADAAAGDCDAASKVGEIETEIGAGGDPLAMTGEIFNVEPNADQPAQLSAKIDVLVGPYDLGTLTIPVDTAIRAGNDPDANRRYGIDATTDVPTRFEGVAVQMRSLDMKLFGQVGGNEFIVNPSKCGSHTVTAELTGDGGQTATETADFEIDNCQAGFNDAPAMTASVNPSETAVPSDLTIGITSSDQNQTIGSIVTELPEGMTINPAIGNSFGEDLTTCPSAALDAADVSGCADAQIGSVTLTTPLLPGTQTGKVYLETPGATAAERYRMAIVVDLPGQKLVVRGKVDVDGSTDLVDGLGSTADSTGQMTATFEPIPDLGFTAMTVAFDTGSRSLLTNPETCGPQTVTATIMPTSGSSAATPTAVFNTSYDGAGAGCPASEPFGPTFSADFSTLQAAGNPDMTLTITRSDKTEQLREFDLALPPGLVANTVDTLRCPQADAAKADCTEASRVGDVSTKIGTGAETLNMTGGIYNVVPDAEEPARLVAIMNVIVGPYDLGKLSIPVTTEIVSGATAADLAIETHTTIPQRYEGMPVRVREMQITLHGKAKQGTPDTSDDKPFMILPSKCATSTITANMESSLGTSASVGDTFTTVNCENAAYNPAISLGLRPGNDASKPVGLDLGFEFDGASSSTKKIRTLLPEGMGINPGIGNYDGANMTCDPADVDAGGTDCPAESRVGTVKLDTPLLPDQRTGAVYLEDPGTGAAERYKLGIYVDLPGSGDLVLHGRATVSGSSDVTNGMGSVDTGTGQVIAEFDDLPDLQFSNLLIEFKTTGGSDHALLTNPEVCGDHTVSAEMSPWSRPTDVETASDTITIDNCEPEGALGLTAAVSSLGVGEHADVTLNLSRPDNNKSIKRATFELPKGLVGSADAAPTCEDDSDSAQAGVCPASTKVGEVALQVGSTDDPFAITGDIFNTEAPSNRPAKLTFAAHVEVGPFDFGRIAVPIDVNIDPNEYFLWAETGNMPQRFEGIPVRINEMQVKLFGMASQGTVDTDDDKPFMSNPRTCSAALNLTAEIVAPDNSKTDLTSQIGPFTGCENLNLDDNAIAISNYNDAPYNDKPERPTKLSVSVTQGTAADQAAMKDMTVSLPGFRLSAAAANGLSACSASQLSNQNCPAASRVGTVWLDTPLLPKNVADPDNVSSDLHSLWGAVYLETPGTAADGSDRYKLAIQLTGKTLITIRGTAIVNETTGEVVTEFKDLPDIPFSEMFVDLTGANTGTGFKPLLLNPENTNTSSGITIAAGASINSWSAPGTVVNRGSSTPVTVEAGETKSFAPNTATSISPMTAGAHPNAIFTYSRADGEEDIKNVKMSLPAGFLGSAAAVPQCTLTQAAAGNCPAASEVGTVVVNIGQYGQYLPMSGHVYLTEGSNGDIAGMSIKVPAEAGPYDLGDYITQGRVIIRPSDHGIDVDFRDVPKMFKGVPTHISNMEITLPGTTSTNKPFLYNASSCVPQNITATITPWSGTASSQNIPYQATGCAGRAFSPAMTFNASGGNGPYDAPAWTIKMGTNEGDSTIKGVTVLLPTIMTVNVQGLASQCQPDVAAARNCGPESQIGTVSIKTPLLTAPVEGKVYMAKSITGSSLPDLLIEIPAPIDMQIRGANSFVNSIQIKSDFQNLPDLVWSEMTMNIGGGPKGLITTRENGTCGPAQTAFASHSGQGVNGTSPVVGLADCVNPGAKCEAPTVNISTKGVKKKGNKKSSNSITFGIPASCATIKSFQVLYPKGSKVNKKQLKWINKKKLNKKQKKANKKNQSNVTGKAGSKALKVFDFQAVGKNGLKIKQLPDGTRSIVMNTKNSTMLLPYKNFCGALKKGKTAKQKKAYKKALKKCQAKSVTFTFVYTLDDGKVVRYNHTMKVSDKKFK